jgi:DNA-binding NarL/FixJ family response regulator
MTPVRIVIADDHEIFRNGFKLLLQNQKEILLVGEAATGEELLKRVEEVMPDVVITDILMPQMNGIDACRAIRMQYPCLPVIALTTFNDEHFVIDMLHAGATGYLLKNTNKAELKLAIQTVREGKMYYSEAIAQMMVRLVAERKVLPGRIKAPVQFTERELSIMELICQQLTNKEIAAKLGLSVRTVESHREKIQEKTQSKNAAGIVLYVLKHNLLK